MNITVDSIGAAIKSSASDFAACLANSWQFTWHNGAPHKVMAEADSDWLRILIQLNSGPTPPGLWAALQLNSRIPGLARFVLAKEGFLQLRADLPLFDGIDLERRVLETRLGFEKAWIGLGSSRSADERAVGISEPKPESSRCGSGEPRSAAASEPEPATANLQTLCTEAGWPFTERGGRLLAVELETPGSFNQALLAPAGEGVRITCELARLDSLTETCQRAVAGLLLAASGVVRMARGSLRADESPAIRAETEAGAGEASSAQIAQFEVVFASAPAAIEISSALDCLSLICSMSGEAEIKALQTPEIAERYLAMRGWDATPANRANERTDTQ
ncbi:MAG: hypothetical protein C5B50_02230 [Verrucomicrobia bacterium]|nr:MAG: hypothetical protein C5B50_02230 [Verrucomicrobiota bacterium]